ncbi:MAG: hypothetical protein NC311_19850 [Muribaculaceae bacterium]|nr:hypothetical protein [Muribaculaceae bacterium]
MKQTLVAFFITLFVALAGIGGYMYYSYIQQCKAPLYRSTSFGDTNVNIDAFYNDKYKVIKLGLTVHETIEDWQIDTIGASTDITLVVKSADGTLKRDFLFQNIFLKAGEIINGSLTIENSTLDDFVMIKELLNGENMTISYSKVLDLDSKGRNKLKQEYYKKKEEERRSEAGLDALNGMMGMMMLGSMLGF